MMSERLLKGRYRLVRVLATGGMGQTYIAEDTHRPGNPQCVVKQLKPPIYNLTPETMATARRLFIQEAEILERIGHHPQIPQLLAYFEEEQEFYLVEEFISGRPLSEELSARGCEGESQVIELLQEILRLLAFVHGHGVIHRDVKPDNLIRRDSDGRLVLIDFGALKQIGSLPAAPPGQVSQTISIGTPGYMPTEQASGKPRFSSDLYAVGMIAIQALTGIPPIRLQEDEQGEIIGRDRVQVSQSMAVFVTKMTRHYFVHRYQTAIEALEALEQVKAGKIPNSQPPTKASLAKKKFKMNLLSRGILLTSLIAIAGGIFLFLMWKKNQKQISLLSEIKQLKLEKDYVGCVKLKEKVRQFPALSAKAEPLITDCENRLMIQGWGLEIQETTFCDRSLVSIQIEQQKYCTRPADWLEAGKYTYIREEDRLEPNWKL